jgi:hypothetical protein
MRRLPFGALASAIALLFALGLSGCQGDVVSDRSTLRAGSLEISVRSGWGDGVAAGFFPTGGPTAAPEGSDRISVELQVRNTGQKVARIPFQDPVMELTGSDETTIGPEELWFDPSYPDVGIRLGPGETGRGAATFLVPRGTDPWLFTWRVSDSEFVSVGMPPRP